jgi:hypothetical protein
MPANEQTHIGKAAVLLLQGNFLEIGKIILRKWLLNWRLLNVSAWGQLFWITIAILAADRIRIWKMKRSNRHAHLSRPSTHLSYHSSFPIGLIDSRYYLIAGISLFLLNDSGVLAAAGCMSYGAVAVLTGSSRGEQAASPSFASDDLAEDRTS